MNRRLKHWSFKLFSSFLIAIIAIGMIIFIVQGGSKGARAATSQSFSATNDPVILIHGFSIDSVTDCNSTWQRSINFLQGTSSNRQVRFTGPMIRLGFYTNDPHCDANLSLAGSLWRNSCIGYDGTSESDVGTNNESIRHLACELAWYVYDNFSQYDTNVQLVSYSMGGIIARYAIYAVQNQLASFPPTFYAHNAVDFDVPNGGVPGPTPPDFNCHCTQALQLLTGSSLMIELEANAENPQGSGWGTNWTMLGSNYDILGCDFVVSPSSSLYMDGGQKIVYMTPCYPHTGSHSMLTDNSTLFNAVVFYCTNCSRQAVLNQNWLNWSTSSNYPHSIREMYSSLFQRLPSTAIVKVPDAQGHDGCKGNTIPANDDGSTGAVSLPFTANFFGITYNSLFVNDNGNVTFDIPLSDYTPYPLNSTSHVIIAPFFADVDTRGSGSGLVTYGSGTYQGHTTFCVNWIDVGYYDSHTDKLNSFQLLLVDRSDRKPGDFDIVMNYNRIQWETGDASGGMNGFGGVSARVGYSNGNTSYFELPNSGISGALLDVNLGLINNSQNSSQLGSYIFSVQNTGTSTPGKQSTVVPTHHKKS